MKIKESHGLFFSYDKGKFHAPTKKRKRKRKRTQSKWRERYQAYIHSLEWYDFRDRVLAERSRRCERCDSIRGVLHVHHLTYWRLGHERDTDVQVICADCHAKIHPRHRNLLQVREH